MVFSGSYSGFDTEFATILWSPGRTSPNDFGNIRLCILLHWNSSLQKDFVLLSCCFLFSQSSGCFLFFLRQRIMMDALEQLAFRHSVL